MPFYRTVYTVEVLSELPMNPDVELDQLHYFITDGEGSGAISCEGSEEIDGPTMARLLMAQGSSPSFFELNDDGTPVEDEWPSN